jgi:hypothetical protein
MPRVTPEELRGVVAQLQEKGILDLEKPARDFVTLEGLDRVRSLGQPDPGVEAAWYVIGGSGYVAVCD